MTTFKNLQIETPEAGIRIVRVSRPAHLNALDTETMNELKTSLSEAANSVEVRVIILTGDGEKSFIAGADISEMKDAETRDAVRFSQLGHEVTKQLQFMPKPTIAAVNGYALGGGCEMALACDFILARENALFGFPEVSLGVVPGFGGTARLAHFVGLPKAKEMIFSGQKIKAQEAAAIGLVNHVFSAAEFQQKVLDTARAISQHSLTAVMKAKQLLNEFSESNGMNFKLDAEAQAFGMLFDTADQREGMHAFIEKRKPKFQGL